MRWQGCMARLAGVGLGLAALAVWLIAWRWASDAAGFFAPALALTTVGCLALAVQHPVRQRELLACGLRAAGSGGALLTIAAALSLGTFLPPQVAEWASPALGHFGGPPALAFLAVTLLVVAWRGQSGRWRWAALDAATVLGVAAVWVWVQIGRQDSFPTPPTTAAVVGPRLWVLCGIAVALGGGGLLLEILRRSASRLETQWDQLH